MNQNTACTALAGNTRRFRFAEPGDGDYQKLSRFIQHSFRKAYEAEIDVSYPQLMGVFGNDGAPLAALGLRNAGSGPLFLEHYLDTPVEQAVAEKTRLHVPRGKIAEAGNLASSKLPMLRSLMFALSLTLKEQLYEYIVFTGTLNLKRYLEALEMKPDVLAEARPEKIGHLASDWGRYYETHPVVMGGQVETFYRGLLAAYGRKSAAG